MNTIFMNSENSRTPHPHRLIFNITDKIILKKSDKYVALSNLRIHYTWRNIKSHAKTVNLKDQFQREMIYLNCLMDHIMYQTLKIILSI